MEARVLVPIRLTKAEKKKITAKAQAYGLSVNGYLRFLINNQSDNARTFVRTECGACKGTGRYRRKACYHCSGTGYLFFES